MLAQAQSIRLSSRKIQSASFLCDALWLLLIVTLAHALLKGELLGCVFFLLPSCENLILDIFAQLVVAFVLADASD
jgi:hypothetical protein